MKAGSNSFCIGISDDDLLECLHGFMTYLMREIYGDPAEESLLSAAHSDALATNAADMSRFVGCIFDAMCKFIAEGSSIE